jgi:microcystin-dependent protein
MQAYSYQGNANVAGTGNASYHPSGVYSTGSNWLYGQMYMNGNNIGDSSSSGNGAGQIYANGWFRSWGDSGWYNQSYGGGVYMVDTTFVRIYNGKIFYAVGGIWSVDTSLVPTQSSGITLGTSTLPWATINGKNVVATSVNSTNITATAMTGTTVTFSNLRSPVNNTNITTIDADPALAAASDNTLATQKAIKSYIDQAISSALATVAATGTSLQNQITAFGYPIPAGTVFYTAAPSVPAGFIEANGAVVEKDRYPALYAALGGNSSPYGQSGASFTLPDLRGVFVRGLDNGAGRDPESRSIGSVQQSALGSHSHLFPGDDQLTFADGTAGWAARSAGNFPYDARSVYGSGGQLWRTSDTGASETRPLNVALLAIIKY